MSTSDRLQKIEAKVRQMERTLGLDNPQVRPQTCHSVLLAYVHSSHVPALHQLRQPQAAKMVCCMLTRQKGPHAGPGQPAGTPANLPKQA